MCQVLSKIWIGALFTRMTPISGVVEMVVEKAMHLSLVFLQYKQFIQHVLKFLGTLVKESVQMQIKCVLY